MRRTGDKDEAKEGPKVEERSGCGAVWTSAQWAMKNDRSLNSVDYIYAFCAFFTFTL